MGKRTDMQRMNENAPVEIRLDPTPAMASEVATLRARLRHLQDRIEVLERWQGTPFVRVLYVALAVFIIGPMWTLGLLWVFWVTVLSS